ncbi:MAG: C40 family peptidase [Desulfobacterales bacterium]|nr:MAG: C40 family peptidase [Desulfobacterales bacterium]
MGNTIGKPADDDGVRKPHPRPAYLQFITFGFCGLLVLTGCSGVKLSEPQVSPISPGHRLALMGYTIQAGAFAHIENALRLTLTLQKHQLEAYHFVDESGLYKVRFGNFPSKNAARLAAADLQRRGILEAYYIVRPDDYAAQSLRSDEDRLRDAIVKTAKTFIGVPYRWGGTSPQGGFDCSGLTTVVYQLNGLDLPRSSREQWKAGKPVKRHQLLKGDLVFFATSGEKRVSHVGIYTGKNQFLHAPGQGRRIQVTSLVQAYFKSRYIGARTYL